MGSFSGYPLTRWSGNRLMIIEEEIFFIDQNKKKWLVPIHSEINGATIPKPLWSIIGSPYVGNYRRASVVHDYFVGEGNNPNFSYKERRAADAMFFNACRTDGCSWKLSVLLYIGVSVGSWASKNNIEHSIDNEDFESISIDGDQKIRNKYYDILEKFNENNFLVENFDLLEDFVENEI